ncbi:MAG: nitroreductase/quinone reductase family protein [Actinomycetia bacterium]|nr:nitroreductase/quinone reductase family protein [Actinomycetes bacterium]
MVPHRAEWQAMNREMVERIGSAPPAPIPEGGYALRVVRTIGRTSGVERAVPLAVLRQNGRRWLVAPRAARDWVANLDAHPSCTIDGEPTPFEAVRRRDLPAATVAQLYARIATGPTQRAFPFPPDADLDEVTAALPTMAVFELVGDTDR